MVTGYNRHRFCLAVLVFCAGSLQACTGLYIDLPNEDAASDVDVTVTPITAALVAARKAAPAEPAARDLQAPYVYRLGPGDILSVSIPSIASGPTPPSFVGRDQEPGYTVAADGTIYLPFVGPMKVAGQSIRDVQDGVIKELSRYIKSPQVTVAVMQFRSQQVLVGGQVPRPGFLPVTDVPLTLVGALAAAGSTPLVRSDGVPRALSGGQSATPQPETGDYTRVRLIRDGQERTYDLLQLLKRGDLRFDPLLGDRDVVYVPPVQRGYVYVLGEVRSPTIVEMVEQRSSLAEVLMTSGGLNQQTSNAERIYVIRGQLSKPTVFQLNADAPDALLLADAFQVEPRDVVYVAEANISRWNRFLAALVPSLQTLITGGVLANNR